MRTRIWWTELWVVAVLLVPGISVAQRGAELQLARDGKTPYVIVRAKDADKAESLAAKELAEHLEKVAGAPFPVVEESGEKPEAAIYVGATQFAARNGVDVAALGREEWVMRTVGSDLVLAGGRPRGTLYAVYEFLEEYLGCLWLDEITEVVPKRSAVTIPSLSVREKPAFWYRDIYTAAHKIWPGRGGWFRLRNKASRGVPTAAAMPHSGSPGGCHTFYAYSKDWPEDHPEYFSMNPHGKRDRARSGSGPGHLCLTNPAVPKLVLERLRQFIVADRARAVKQKTLPPRVYDISQNDNNRYVCLCPPCKEVSEREGSESGLMIQFINQVADGIKAEHPDILVQTFAYTTTQNPPKTLKPRDNVLIRLCDLGAEFGCGAAEYFKPLSHEFNRPFQEQLKRWSEIAKNLAIWDYWILYSPNDRFPTPYVNVSFLKPDIELFLDHNAQTVFVECEKPETTSFFALKRWLGYKLLQDPRQPAEPLIQRFMEGYYGPAGPHMRAYLAYLEKRIIETPTRMSTVKEYLRPYMDLEFFITCQGHLDRAEEACKPGSPERLHVQRERIPVDSALYNLWDGLKKKLPKGQKMPFDRAAVLNRYEAYRLAQMEAYRPKSTLQKGKEELAEEMSKYRQREEIEQRKAQAPPTVIVPEIPPVDGGGPEKADWAKALDLGTWHANEGYTTDRKLAGRIAHDGAHLYIELAEQCDPAKLVSTPEVWSGDDWEVFFAARRGAPPYRQIAIGPKGAVMAYHWDEPIGKQKPKLWSSGVQVASTASDGCWRVRLSIPLSHVVPGGVKRGGVFYANFYRASSGAEETFAWSPNFERGFHVLARLGELKLE